MKQEGQHYPPERRIRARRDYLKVRDGGKKIHTRHFLIQILEKGAPTRLGITVSRKVGGAVERNRVKRLVREFFRRHYPWLPEGADISIVAKRGSPLLDYQRACSELEILCRHQAQPRS